MPVVMGDRVTVCWSSDILSPLVVRFEGDLGLVGWTGPPLTTGPDAILSPLLCLDFALVAGGELFRLLSDCRTVLSEIDGGLPVLEFALSLPVMPLTLPLPFGIE